MIRFTAILTSNGKYAVRKETKPDYASAILGSSYLVEVDLTKDQAEILADNLNSENYG